MIEAFFDELSDGICVSDERDHIVYLNPAAERLLGARSSQANGRAICELLCGHLSVGGAPECASSCELRRRDSSATAVTFQGRHGPRAISEWKDFAVKRRAVWKNLRVRCLRASLSIVGEGRRLTIIEDVTAEVEAAKQKEDWREMIAHDLRSPLTSIFGTLRLLQEAADASTPAVNPGLIDISVRSCQKMLGLLELYLDVAKLDAGVAQVQAEPIALAELVRAGLEEQLNLTRAQGVGMSSNMPEDLLVRADRELLDRVIQNLINNAVKFTPKGGRVTVSARLDGRQAWLSVKDTGMGIAAAELPFLFDRYYQAKARRAGKTQGTGLGLTFCREALTCMGGSIEVQSESGQGAEFIVRLPAAAAQLAPKAALSAAKNGG